MNNSNLVSENKHFLKLQVCKRRKSIWLVSTIAIILSIIAFTLSFFDPSIKAPLRPGLDFTGGTQIQLERRCSGKCDKLDSSIISQYLKEYSNKTSDIKNFPSLSQSRVQVLDESSSLVVRTPFLSASQSQSLVDYLMPHIGPLEEGGQFIETIGPSLGVQLLKSSLISLLVAFIGIALYISARYDKNFATLALVALIHDVIIVCGVFSWLGLLTNLEVNSLFAVALLTIAGYSVNDTVVVFDRIREYSKSFSKLDLSTQIENAVSATLTRTLYTSGTTLLPLLAIIFFGGDTLYWFAIALVIGVVVGSWSSIALAPSLLSLRDKDLENK